MPVTIRSIFFRHGDFMMKRLLLTASAVIFTWTVTAPPVSAGDQPVPPVQPSIPLPQTLSPDKFDHPILKRAYAAAGRHRQIVAQLPCYCWCSRMGHRSLLDCFASNHGANCDICIKEVLLADEMVKEGKTAAQIKDAVIRKDYENVQLK
jgi:hypothetical protein